MILFMATALALILYNAFVVDDPEEANRIVQALAGALVGSGLSFFSFLFLTNDTTNDDGKRQ